MKEGVLLISMPFADASFPSLALSQLKAILREKAGICCDLLYLNMAFRNFTGRSEIYDRVNAYTLFGEWPFGEDLFGADWAESDRGGISFMERIRPLGMENPEPARSDLRFMRSCAGPFLDKWMAAIPWDRYGVIGFTSVYFQQVASLALARRIKKAYPEKIIAFGGANCNEATDKALLKLFPFIDWIFCGQADCSFPKAVLSWCKHPSNIPEKIQGVSYRDHGAVMTQGSGESESLDRLPVPDFEDFKAGLETWAPDIQSPMIPIELSRGCWWGRRSQCIFCGVNHNMLFFRSKSPERALDEIRTVVGRYGIQKIYITDSILKTGYFKTLLPACCLTRRDEVTDRKRIAESNASRPERAVHRKGGAPAADFSR